MINDYEVRRREYLDAKARATAILDQMEAEHGELAMRMSSGSTWSGYFKDGTSVEIPAPVYPPTWPCPNEGCDRTTINPSEPCYRCSGDARLTNGQRAYLAEVEVIYQDEGFPHCDSLILHAPEMCEYCGSPDASPLRDLRRKHNIAWTNGVQETGQEPCPSEAYRPAEVRDRWYGNVAEPPV